MGWVYAAALFVLLVTAIVAIVKVETALMRCARARRHARNAARLAEELTELRRDPRLGRWAALAERHQRVDRARLEEWENRYQSLLADPWRRPFAERTLHGEFRTDDEIDYLLDPGVHRTCEHLRPIEGALRAARVACRGIPGPHGATPLVATDATLDEPTLRARFDLPAFVEWQVTPPEPHEAGGERLVCTRCTSSIENGRGPLFPPRA